MAKNKVLEKVWRLNSFSFNISIFKTPGKTTSIHLEENRINCQRGFLNLLLPYVTGTKLDSPTIITESQNGSTEFGRL